MILMASFPARFAYFPSPSMDLASSLHTASFHFSIERRIGNSPSVSMKPVRNNFVKPNKQENEPSARCLDSLRIIMRQMIMNEGM